MFDRVLNMSLMNMFKVKGKKTKKTSLDIALVPLLIILKLII